MRQVEAIGEFGKPSQRWFAELDGQFIGDIMKGIGYLSRVVCSVWCVSPVRQSATREVAGDLFDLERLRAAVLESVRAGAAARDQVYDWDRDAMGDWVEIAVGRPVAVEGVYSTEAGLRDLYDDLRIFCVAGYEIRLRRGLERDGEAARSKWELEWMPAEQDYLDFERPDPAMDLLLQDESFGDSATFTLLESRE